MRKIECIFGKKLDGAGRYLELIMKTSCGCYFCGADGLYLLCDAGYGEIYFAIGCPDVQNILRTENLRVGAEYRCEDGLFLGETVLIGKRQKTISPPHRYLFKADQAKKMLAERGKGALADAFYGRNACDGTNKTLLSAFDAFCGAMDLGRIEKAATIAAASVGLGRGLTPDFDDFLIGMLYAFRESGTSLQWMPVADAVRDSLSETTRFSAEFLQCAVQGEAFSPVTDVLRGGDANAVARLMSAGHSSGSSMLVGMLTADRMIRERNHAVS